MSRLRIGILAPEFPPQVGGMEEYAGAVATALSKTDEVVVFTRPRKIRTDTAFEQIPVLRSDLAATVKALGQHRVDVWYAINSALVAVAPALPHPWFASCHGNDFLSPWIGYTRPWENVARWFPRLRPRIAGVVRADRRRWIRKGLPFVRRLFANSHATAAAFDAAYPGFAERLSVVPCGVHDDFLRGPVRETPRADGPLRLLTVARLSAGAARKNVDGVIRALARISDRVPVHYTIVGDGDRRSELMALAETLGVANCVAFLGEVTRAELIEAYRDADLFVLASKASDFDVEGFGIVYLEANACGVPVLCSREGGSIEAVEDGRSGLVIDESSTDSIASAIIKFSGARDRFNPAQLRSFAEGYRWPVTARRIRSLISDGLATDH